MEFNSNMTIKEIHEFLMDLRDSIEIKVTSSEYNKLDDCIDALSVIAEGKKDILKVLQIECDREGDTAIVEGIERVMRLIKEDEI